MPESLLTLLNKRLRYKFLSVNFAKLLRKPVLQTLREKSPYSELFWPAFFPHFPACPNAGKCGKNADQNSNEYGLILRCENSSGQVLL